jgi:prolipoprotein diacylglyceryltransferase
MILPVVPTLALKFLVWALALAAFLRNLGPAWQAGGGTVRRPGGALLLGACAGAKLVYALNYPALAVAACSGDPAALLMLAGGGSAPGALLGAALALWWAGPRMAPGFGLDGLVAPAALALCVLDCGNVAWALGDPGFGVPTRLPWGIDFGDGVTRHPVMLYEAVFFGLAAWLAERPGAAAFRPGERALLFLIAYCGLRMLIDYLRPPFGAPLLVEMLHPAPWLYGRLMTGEQWVCMLAVAALLPAWLRTARRLLAERGQA